MIESSSVRNFCPQYKVDSFNLIQTQFGEMKYLWFVSCAAFATLASADPGVGPCGPRPPTKPDFDQNMVFLNHRSVGT